MCNFPICTGANIHHQRRPQGRNPAHQSGQLTSDSLKFFLRHFQDELVMDLHDEFCLKPFPVEPARPIGSVSLQVRRETWITCTSRAAPRSDTFTSERN